VPWIKSAFDRENNRIAEEQIWQTLAHIRVPDDL